MKGNAGMMLVPILAVALFALIAFETVGALQASGAWSGVWQKRGVAPTARPDDPFTPIGGLLEHPQPPLPEGGIRDPFTLGAAPAPVASGKPVVRKPVTPPPPARPVLTAIVWDTDPRAIVRWQGRDWTVHPGGLFDEFQVVGITRTQVTLSRGTETLVLQRKTQGD